MKLYYTPGACSQNPHIALREAGLKFDLEKVDLGAHKTEKGTDFYTINPKGYVPVLELDNGQLLTENPAIVQYIADLKPESKLAPPNGTLERYRLQEWLGFIGTEVHRLISPLWYPNLPDEQRKSIIERAGKRFEYLSKELGSKPYLMGEQFTVADSYLFVMCNWVIFHKVDLGQWPVLKAFHERVSARPAVKATLEAEFGKQ